MLCTCVFVISASSLRWCGMTISSNETEKLSSQADRSDSFGATDEMKSGSFAPSRLVLGIYHRLLSFAVYCMSTSATAVLIFLLLFWYYGGVCLLTALLISVLGEQHWIALLQPLWADVCCYFCWSLCISITT